MDTSDNPNEGWLAANLNQAIKDEARGRLQTGQTNDTMYTKLWEQTLPELDGKASNAFWGHPDIPFTTVKQVLKARYGQIWTKRRARNFRMPYFRGGKVSDDIRCPLCGRDDSTGHMLGECHAPDMKSIYIERHNEAARMILSEVMKGEYGNRIVCMDVGSNSKVEHLGVRNRKIPSTIISDRTLLMHEMTTEDRAKLRPDALIIESTDAHLEPRKRDAQRRRKINRLLPTSDKDNPMRPCKAFIVEVGYAAETRYAAKVVEKTQQHKVLSDLLKAEGFEVVMKPIVLGTTGGIFVSHNQLLEQLGVVKTRRERLNRKLHVHSIKTMHNLIKLRRVKEAESRDPTAPRTKKPPDR